MGQFEKLTEYKNKILRNIISNENLVKSLIDNRKDYLNYNLPDGFDSTSLIYSQVFPYQHTLNAEKEMKTYITMSFGKYNYVNNVFKSGILYFYIFTNKLLIETDYGLRTDYILDQIDTMFNKNSDVGVFNLEIDSGGDFRINEDYLGTMISYKFYDFQ